jgi:hypothetical protein
MPQVRAPWTRCPGPSGAPRLNRWSGKTTEQQDVFCYRLRSQVSGLFWRHFDDCSASNDLPQSPMNRAAAFMTGGKNRLAILCCLGYAN